MIKKIIFRIWGLYRIIREKYVLDIHIVEHCNLNCKCCVHFSPIAEKKFLDVKKFENIMQYFKKRRLYKFFNEIHLIGGEPLLHPQILEILNIIRVGFPKNKSKIKLITNGLILKLMNDYFWEICKQNEIIVSITQYPINLNYNNLIDLCKNHNVQYEFFENHIDVPFWQFKIKESIPYKDTKSNFYGCYSHDAMQLNDEYIYICPLAAHSYHLNKRFRSNFTVQKKDFLEINKLNLMNFWRFRLTPKPFCSYCIFPRKPINWEKSKFSSSEWIET